MDSVQKVSLYNPTSSDIIAYPIYGESYTLRGGETLSRVRPEHADTLQKAYPWLQKILDTNLDETTGATIISSDAKLIIEDNSSPIIRKRGRPKKIT